MRISTNQGFHLTYCTNIHPGEEWRQVRENLETYIPPLKAHLSPKNSFAIGLRLADIAAQELLARDNLAHFKTWLNELDLYVFTLNGFPFGKFHHHRVKDRVYAPDWTSQARLDYTIRLAKILAVLLDEGMDGGISTLPLSYKPWWRNQGGSLEKVFRDCCEPLVVLVLELNSIREATGKVLHLDLEPEPNGLLENAADVIDFFETWLLPLGGKLLAERQGISPQKSQEILLDHIRICYDTCHFAVEYEDPTSVCDRLQKAGIKIGKIQLSAAIQVDLKKRRAEVMERLQAFVESTYLHQVIERWADGKLVAYPDLEIALPNLKTTAAEEWRIHFHVPIFIRDYHLLNSTQVDLIAVLDLLKTNAFCQHLEIETYTWQVLPPPMQMDLLSSIEREYEWVLEKMTGQPTFVGQAS